VVTLRAAVEHATRHDERQRPGDGGDGHRDGTALLERRHHERRGDRHHACGDTAEQALPGACALAAERDHGQRPQTGGERRTGSDHGHQERVVHGRDPIADIPSSYGARTRAPSGLRRRARGGFPAAWRKRRIARASDARRAQRRATPA